MPEDRPDHLEAMQRLTQEGYDHYQIAAAMIRDGYFKGRSRSFAVSFVNEFQRRLARQAGAQPQPDAVTAKKPVQSAAAMLREQKIDDLAKLLQQPKKKYFL